MTLDFTSNTRNHLLILLFIALLIRVGAAFYLGNEVSGLSGAHDEISYSMLGWRYASGHGMTFPENWYPWIEADAPQSYYSYAISLFIAGIYSLFGYMPLAARLIMAIQSTLIVLMIYLIAERLFNKQVAILSGIIATGYAYLVFYGVTLVTETPFTLALLIALYICIKIRTGESSGVGTWLLLGFVLAIAVLLRMAVVFFIPVLLLWLLTEKESRKKLPMIVIPIAMIAIAVLPLTIRNYMLWERFLLLEAQFGHVLWNGNHLGHQGNFHPFRVFDIPADVLALKNDVDITNTLLRMGIQGIFDNPMNFIQLTASRLREFFLFWPTVQSTLEANILRVLSFGLIFPFAVVGVLANLRRIRELAPVYLFIIMHIGIYAVTWTMIRYRIPIDPLLIMFASYTIVVIYNSITNRHVQKPVGLL